MSGIAPFVIIHVNRLRVMFRDDIGNAKTIQGTGFWVKHEGLCHFITNAHNVEPRMKLGAQTSYKFESAAIALRLMIGADAQQQTKFINISSPNVIIHPTADVALFRAPEFDDNSTNLLPAKWTYTFFNSEDLASEQFLRDSLAAMDVASFIGYPGQRGIPWYDEQWNLAIARTVNIASWPAVSFANQAVPTSDTMLVSGLSFSGSSGSPVIAHEKGIRTLPGSGLKGYYVPPKLIGIMSGHWSESDAQPDVFRHSGLSYLTRSPAILSLLPSAGLTPMKQ